LSRQVKETIKIVLSVLVVGALLFFYWIYPLNRSKAMWGRADLETYNRDSTLLMPNDPSIFSGSPIVVDTFRVESDGSATLACLYLHRPDPGSLLGTVVLLHSDRTDRNSMKSLALALADSGFGVVMYDQRASGLSTGKYHSDGQMEAADLESVVGHLGLHSLLTAPLIVAGWKLGADAALGAALEEKRISAVLAVEPYLSSRQLVDSYQAEFRTWRIPLYRTIIWFWFNARSSYGLDFRDDENIPGVACRTLLMTTTDPPTDPALKTLVEKSGSLLAFVPATNDLDKLVERIVSLTVASHDSN